MTSVRDELLGVSLSGRYRLEEWLGGDEHAAFFLTSTNGAAGDPDASDGVAFGESAPKRAVLKLIPETPAAAPTLALWRRTAALSHPHLLPLLDCGTGISAGRSFVYALFEFPDESLSAALEQHALDESESREIWNAVVDALRYIHSQGLVHGSVDPDHIVAVGDRVKLASDELREPGPAFSAADDFRALAKIGLQAGPAPAPVPAPVAPRAPRARRSFPVWVYAAIAALIALSVFAFVRRRRGPSEAPVPASRTAAPAAKPAPPKRAPEVAARTVTPQPEQARSTGVWRVVAYTYSSFQGAEKKARSINERHPGLHAEVFTPKGRNRPPYFVALGGRMSRAEAAALQKQARSKGLPRDTFIRNFSAP